MKPDRITRVNELIRRELGTQLYRIVTTAGFDPSAVTFTHAITSVDLRSCRVLVSIRGDADEQERILSILKRHRNEFQSAVSSNLVLRYTPQLHFVLDHSVEQGDQILHLIQQMQDSGELPSDEEIDRDESSIGDPAPPPPLLG